ncbi:hypothetical protein ACFVH4_17680 [Nocardia ignorata]|uniref:DUF7373 family lipoprotein n=1 Tax=Nocardia ignorata TaxID=145285 RepID=UPI00363C42BD
MHAGRRSSFLYILRSSAIAGAVALCTGCGSTVVGTPQPGITTVDVTKLRAGPFQTEPAPFKLNTGVDEPDSVRLIEARRLLNYLIQPSDIDPDVHYPGTTAVFATHVGIPVSAGILNEHKSVIKDNVKFIAGAASVRDNGSVRNPKEISVAILQFESEPESDRAAAELNKISMASGERDSIEIPGNPGTYSSTLGNSQIDTWQKHGPYVVLVSVKEQAGDIDGLTSEVDAALNVQNQALDSQHSIPLDDVLDTPLDPDNIVRRTMDRDNRDTIISTDDFGVYLPAGILHFQRNPVDAKNEFDKSGVDLVGRRASTVFRTRDVEGAFNLQTFLSRKGKDDTALDPPPGIADAQCVRFDSIDDNEDNALCAVVHGRYVAVISGKSTGFTHLDSGLQERTAAQYIILEKCE